MTQNKTNDTNQLNFSNKVITGSMINDEDKWHAASEMSNRDYNKIMTEYLSGNWQTFFKIWNVSFSSDFKESTEYKIMTLKLRVHYAILPIRIVQLHQNINCASNCSNKVSEILGNFAVKYRMINDEKKLSNEQSKLIIDSMKQLEYFLNSRDGQNLIMVLKDSSCKAFFALPYIVNPQEDESLNKIFSIDWLEQLTVDLEKFLRKFFQNEILLSEQELEVFQHDLSSNVKNSKEISMIFCDRTNKLTNNSNVQFISNGHSSSIHSVIKNKQIEDWIIRHRNKIEDNNSRTKSTQTHISTIRTGIASINEPHTTSVIAPSVFTVCNQQMYSDELSAIKLRLFNLHKQYKTLKLRFHKLHEDYQKMNEVAEVLTISLENSVRGKPVNLDMILQSCVKIFPDKFNRNIQTDSEDTSIEFKEDILKNEYITEDKQSIINNIPVPPNLLNYKKIKFDLKCGDTKTKLLLLQALRRKLTSNQAEYTNDIIYEYTMNDLLGLKENISNTSENNILLHLLQPVNLKTSVNYMQQTTSRFLNTLASLSCGRIYLSSSPLVLNIIIMYLDSCSNGVCDAVTIDMLLATLQKMSLYKQQRNYMIEANFVEWIIYHLSTEHLRMRTYRLEYTCALLMNLSLHSSARSRASVMSPLFVSTMISLLSIDCVLILPYINGVLQNFLTNNEINEEAKKLGLTEILEYHCTESDEELRNHFLRTLKIHESEFSQSLSDDEFPDEDNGLFNVFENELEEDDPVKVPIGELQGEKFLALYYSVPTFISQLKHFSNKNIVSLTTTSIDNLSSNNNKRAEFNDSKISTTSETRFSDSKAEIMDKKSSTEVVNSTKKILYTTKNEIKSHDKEEQDAFLAKPKIMRTPPPSAQKEMNQEKIPKKK